ncbi:TIGR02757 family protein [Parasediminibacterium sp. JCM 36343]|uniref:TIGR02757 family protein n=1 Tax=Parasediminibacterium sp. JCM 36343 TaxID=3374279 RepID=UPI003978362D
MDTIELKEFLDFKTCQYNNLAFIEHDPIAIPHRYTQKEDIEIAGFLAATIAWGNRKIIVKNGHRMMDLLGNSPYDFVINHQTSHLEKLEAFVHRTFNGADFAYFIKGLQHIYQSEGGIEKVFADNVSSASLQPAIHHFKKHFFAITHPLRATKHVSDPLEGSAAKRINMYLRWMVRKDKMGVDFGLWHSISPSQLSCPLDVHSGNIARKLGLLARVQNDAKAVAELDASLRLLDSNDPVKYDFALFGLGIFEKF